jgi:phosphoribosylanthranilate isomerase
MIPAKICGITRLDDALLAIELGASAVGFVFYKKSPRRIDVDPAAKICEQIPKNVSRVGVFANPDLQEVLSTVATVSLTHVQFCGEESPALCKQSPLPVIKSVRPSPNNLPSDLDEFSAVAFLIDSQQNGAYGGTGMISDWGFCYALRFKRFTILAGGIGAHNVRDAVAHAGPDAVDLCSSVEKSPGVKDHDKLRTFFDTLRSIDDNNSRLSNGFLSLS